MLALNLTAKESAWRLFTVRKNDPAFQSFQEKVLKRDDHTCQYCGFKALEFLEVVNCDGNYRNNKLDNLTTACPFCAQCCFLDGIGKSDFGGGTLVYLPEMTQNELNALCHVLFGSMVTGDSQSGQSKNIYRSLRLRSQVVEKKLGEGMSNPALYGQLLIDATHDGKEAISQELSQKIRVLPQFNRFVSQIETWQTSAMNAITE